MMGLLLQAAVVLGQRGMIRVINSGLVVEVFKYCA